METDWDEVAAQVGIEKDGDYWISYSILGPVRHKTAKEACEVCGFGQDGMYHGDL
jgi:hypothetical protein